ncbi:MAG: hypothetical protein H0W70_04615, partial [Actinobacteria bacterium]|nr:hypothetical protein [Actinomycetota bacterium]
ARLLSEPLALLSLAVVLAATHSYLARPRGRTVAVLVVAAAVGGLTRFPGVVPAVCAALAIAMWSTGDVRRRLTRAGVVLAAALLPLGAWLMRNAVVSGQASDRRVGLHPPGAAVWRQAADKTLAWVGPHHLPWATVTLLVVVALLLWAARASWQARHLALAAGPPSLPALCVMFAAAYALFVVAVRSLLDNNLSFGSRMFLPVLLLATIAVTSAAATLPSWRRAWVGALCTGVLVWSAVVLVATNIPRFPRSISAGYAASAWRASPTIAFLAKLDRDVAIVSNAPDPIWLHIRRTPLFLPLGRDLFSGGPNQHYDEQLSALQRALRGQRAIVAFFDHPTRSPKQRVLGVKLRNALGLTPLARYRDATVYSVGAASAVVSRPLQDARWAPINPPKPPVRAILERFD